MIVKLKPAIVLLEEVMGFTKTDASVSESPLTMFVKRLWSIKGEGNALLYPHVHVFEVSPKAWLYIPRDRTAIRIARASSDFLGHTTHVLFVLSSHHLLFAVTAGSSNPCIASDIVNSSSSRR